jgi:hypothetical protein
MLKISNWRRRFMARAQSQFPVRRRSKGIAFHREHDHVDRHTDRQLPYRTPEVVQPVFRVDAGTRRRHVAHRRQTVDEQVDVVRLGVELLQRVEPGVQARAALRVARAQCRDGRIELAAIVDRNPSALGVRHEPCRLIAEADDLHVRARRNLRREPVDRVDDLLPLRRPTLLLVGHVTAPQDVDDRAIEHARRRVHENRDVAAAHA